MGNNENKTGKIKMSEQIPIFTEDKLKKNFTLYR